MEGRRGRRTAKKAGENDTENGDDGSRTHNPRLAKAVLSQLSYVPDTKHDNNMAAEIEATSAAGTADEKLRMRAPRFELGTSTLSG